MEAFVVRELGVAVRALGTTHFGGRLCFSSFPKTKNPHHSTGKTKPQEQNIEIPKTRHHKPETCIHSYLKLIMDFFLSLHG